MQTQCARCSLTCIELQVRGARVDLTFELFPEAPLAFAHFGFGAHAFDMRPGAFGHFRNQREVVWRPYMRCLVMDCHERGQAALLDQRHADGRADANALEGRSLLGRDQRGLGLMVFSLGRDRPTGLSGLRERRTTPRLLFSRTWQTSPRACHSPVTRWSCSPTIECHRPAWHNPAASTIR